MPLFPEINASNQKIELEILKKKKITLFLKREDLSHPLYGGNKVRKLKYHVLDALTRKSVRFLTFGGAWSNHIYASSAFFKEIDQPIIGVIRGEEPSVYSDTLLFAKDNGMQLHFVSRSDYRRRNDQDYLKELLDEFDHPYIIPEGGSGEKGVQGCVEILTPEDRQFDFVASAAGTGGTIAGITLSLQDHQKSIAFSALKGGEFLKGDIEILMEAYRDKFPVDQRKNQLILQTGYHFGGFAKSNRVLIEFMRNFYRQTAVQLDHIYTGKMMYGLLDMIASDYFPAGTKILAIHTGGQQGLKGLEKRIGEPIFPF